MSESLIAERFGRQITLMRERRGISKVQLARLAGVTRQKIAEVERGQTTVALSYYCLVLSALGCELEVVPSRLPTLEELQDVFV
ncbi:helix-turn-helix domain-containing protein [Pseudomonas sp.]|uniref:helix-turn-helix domain-containing protein n=1 Tax=Pseudomonas sp. TaxID=306 RepID=UPI0028AF23FE|nr:helix-turn-helix domain-containing protein [Pseudomonas sp.]